MAFGSENFVGGALCLDFVNTVGGHRDGEPRESLQTYGDLVEWAVAGNVVTKLSGAHLNEMAKAHEARAARVLVDAKRLRETIYEVFVAVADGRKAPASEIAALSAAMSEAHANLQLRASGSGYQLAWPAPTDLRAPLWPVVKSAVDLLVGGETRLRECASDTCGWLFVDESRNHSRRWCSMRDCGNRAKVRRFRAQGA
jgi:predicted RNA-binding Zn ribbon-like protein